MRAKAIAVLSIFGLLLGLGSLYLVDISTTCGCPMQLAGHPLNCDCSPDLAILAIPATIAILSAVGLVYSFLPSRTTPHEAERAATP
jgi:hypothetical protein